MQAESLREEVGKISWFHRIDLGNGIVTPDATILVPSWRRYIFPPVWKG